MTCLGVIVLLASTRALRHFTVRHVAPISIGAEPADSTPDTDAYYTEAWCLAVYPGLLGMSGPCGSSCHVRFDFRAHFRIEIPGLRTLHANRHDPSRGSSDT
ncbi:hypothetical protein BV25DRAFT_1190993 [Artomyces pyxidatus]|uniref:Uncharacterized protein n=1 Tax=Artomyces pyxidatus TaxID=48021 RepID=A0ACB8SR96_9AGAM|nr:hypothetical protein BV25DRAFT_1190993 [Artomyces pyxidatus]